MTNHDTNKREELIDAAEKLFSKNGYPKTSVDDICNEVGVAHGLFYHYFDSKKDVIGAITEKMMGGLESNLEEMVKDTEMGAEEKFRRFHSLSLQKKKKRPYLASSFSKKRSPRVYYNLFNKMVEVITPYLTEIVKQGIDEGMFHTEYPEQAVRFWLNGRLFLTGEDQLFREGILEDMKAEAFMVERLLGAERGFLTSFYEEREEEIKAFLEEARGGD